MSLHALAPDGLNDYAALASPVSLDPDGSTVELWLQYRYGFGAILGCSTTTAFIGFDASSPPRLEVIDDAWAGHYFPLPETLVEGETYHIVVEREAGVVHVYVDDVEALDTWTTSAAITLDQLWRWQTGASGYWGACPVYAARFYSVALTPEERAQNFAAGVQWLPVAEHSWSIAELAVAPAQRVYAIGAVHLAATKLADLPLSGGTVTADARRAQTRDASLDLSPAAADIDALYGVLVTPGAEVTLERGFVLPDGSRIGAALGRFVVDEVTRKEDSAGASLSATLSDLSKRVSRARWSNTYSVPAGTSLAAALNGIIRDRVPTILSRITAATALGTLGASATFDAGADSDPWSDARGLASAFGYTLVIDVDGYAVTLPAPILSAGASVFTFARGAAAIVTDRSRVAPLERTYNGVIVTGEGPELAVPLRAEAWDSSPASPTYYLGAFGRVPLFYSSPLITTAAQAAAAASTRLAGIVGRVEQLSWSHVVHPGLRPLDVVLVEGAAGELTPYVLDALTIPLSVGGAAGAVAREIQVTY